MSDSIDSYITFLSVELRLLMPTSRRCITKKEISKYSNQKWILEKMLHFCEEYKTQHTSLFCCIMEWQTMMYNQIAEDPSNSEWYIFGITESIGIFDALQRE